MCVFISVQCGEFAAARRMGSFIMLKQIREKVQDVIWKKIIAAWPHSFARLGRKKNIVPPSSSWNTDRFCRCAEGLPSLDIFLLPVLLFCSLVRVVLDYFQFLIPCPNPHKLLYLNSLFVLVSAGSHYSIYLCRILCVNQNQEIETLKLKSQLLHCI